MLYVTGPPTFPLLKKHTNRHREGRAVEPKRQVKAEKEHSKACKTGEKTDQTRQKDGGEGKLKIKAGVKDDK